MPLSPYDRDLDRNPANYQPLTPLTFLERAAAVFPIGWRSFTGPAAQLSRVPRAHAELASALARRGFTRGDTVAVMLANTPAMLECHYGVPMCGAVLNTLNTRLDAATIAFMLDHGEAKALIVDREFSAVIAAALKLVKIRPLVIDYDDPEYDGPGERLGEHRLRGSHRRGRRGLRANGAARRMGRDSAQLHFGHDRRSQGRGLSSSRREPARRRQRRHRRHRPPSRLSLDTADVPLQRLVLSLVDQRQGGRACLPAPGARQADVRPHRRAQGHPHVRRADRHVDPAQRERQREAAAAAHRALLYRCGAPPAAVLAAMREAGFEVTHLYGLTEVYGPAVVNDWKDEWNALGAEAQAHLKARQGVRYHALEALDVMDPETMQPVPADGETMGEVMFRGNVVMKGYLKNKAGTEKALAGGWFHSGDLGVKHPDGYVQLKDRSKDIIISGGENISSIEVEDVLFDHPGVQLAAVVARPDDKWGETPCAFVEMKPGHNATAEELMEWCRARLARYKCPRHIVFAEIPKTSTGKVQKFALRERAKMIEAEKA